MPLIEYDYRYKGEAEGAWKNHLKNAYGITIEEWDLLIESQGEVCGACGVDTDRLNLDHNHSNGRVRGIICSKCNNWIGRIERGIWKREIPETIMAYFLKNNNGNPVIYGMKPHVEGYI